MDRDKCDKLATVAATQVIAVNSEFRADFTCTCRMMRWLSQAETFFFCKSFPLQPFFFFFSTDYIIPQTFTVTSSIGCFYFEFFSFTMFSYRFRAVD